MQKHLVVARGGRLPGALLWRGRFAAIVGAGCASVGCAGAERPAPPPAVFGGQGAVIAASKEPTELPLTGDAAAAASPSGPCAAPSPATEVALLDDFEDGDAKLFKGFEREGWWFAATDATDAAKIHPEGGKFVPDRRPRSESTKDDLFAAHLKAEGQRDWGVVWGTSLRWESKGIRCPLNASGFAGIRFRAKGPGTVRVAVGVPETQPPDSGGTCKSACYDTHGKVVFMSDHWDDYLLVWDRLQQGGWGAQSRFDPARIVSLNFSVHPNELPADFWIDDLAFVTAREAESLTASRRSQLGDVPNPVATDGGSKASASPGSKPAPSTTTKGAKPR